MDNDKLALGTRRRRQGLGACAYLAHRARAAIDDDLIFRASIVSEWTLTNKGVTPERYSGMRFPLAASQMG